MVFFRVAALFQTGRPLIPYEIMKAIMDAGRDHGPDGIHHLLDSGCFGSGRKVLIPAALPGIFPRPCSAAQLQGTSIQYCHWLVFGLPHSRHDSICFCHYRAAAAEAGAIPVYPRFMSSRVTEGGLQQPASTPLPLSDYKWLPTPITFSPDSLDKLVKKKPGMDRGTGPTLYPGPKT